MILRRAMAMTNSGMEPFQETVTTPNSSCVQEAKQAGKKVVGFFCSYVPLELLDAAGVLPYRVTGVSGRDTGTGTTYLSSRVCTFCRNALTLALEEDFSFIDGLLGTNTCDPVRRASQNWTIKNPPAFTDFIHIPRVYREENVSRYTVELERLKSALEEWLEIEITDEKLRQAIEARNRARVLIRGLSRLRAGPEPPISGAEMLAVSVAYHQMPVGDFIEAAEKLLSERREIKRDPGKVRVLLAGGMLDDPEYVKFIEEQGLDVVADPTCFGLRSYDDDVDLDKPPVEAIAERYMRHFPCARMGESFPLRWERILQAYDDYNADGIIYQRLKFCQLWGVDSHNMTPLCEERDMPLLYLEREYGFFSTGQLKTRLQAFTELIEDRKSLKT
jgi:benzoyl-CoA reductase subunit C